MICLYRLLTFLFCFSFIFCSFGMISYAVDDVSSEDVSVDDASSGDVLSDRQLGLSGDGGNLDIVESVPDAITVDTLTVNAGSVVLSEDISVYAVDAPSGHWVKVSGAPVDMIYIPANYSNDAFYVSNGLLYGMYSSTVTGYADGYTFRFSPYSTPQYRTDSSNYSWTDVNLTLVDAHGVEVEGYTYYFDEYVWLLFLLLGGIVLCLFIRRL